MTELIVKAISEFTGIVTLDDTSPELKVWKCSKEICIDALPDHFLEVFLVQIKSYRAKVTIALHT